MWHIVIANYSVNDLISFLANFIQHFVSCLIDLDYLYGKWAFHGCFFVIG